jgi:hypothetical protein
MDEQEEKSKAFHFNEKARSLQPRARNLMINKAIKN